MEQYFQLGFGPIMKYSHSKIIPALAYLFLLHLPSHVHSDSHFNRFTVGLVLELSLLQFNFKFVRISVIFLLIHRFSHPPSHPKHNKTQFFNTVHINYFHTVHIRA